MDRIILGNGYSVCVDPNNYTLVKTVTRRSNETGEPYEDNVIMGYFRGLPEAIEHCYTEKVRDSLLGEDKTAREAAEAIKKVFAEFKALINEEFPDMTVSARREER